MSVPEERSSSKNSLVDAIKAVPPRAKQYLARGIVVLFSQPRSVQEKALQFGSEIYDSSFALDEMEMGEDLGLSNPEARQAMNAARFMSALLASHSDATADRLVEGLRGNDLLAADQVESALLFAAHVIEKRAGITEAFEKASLRNSVLPSLQKFETVVDLRLIGSDAALTTAVPVVLFLIDTDADREALWCQLSKVELKAVIQKLTKTLQRVESAEEWVSARSGSRDA